MKKLIILSSVIILSLVFFRVSPRLFAGEVVLGMFVFVMWSLFSRVKGEFPEEKIKDLANTAFSDTKERVENITDPIGKLVVNSKTDYRVANLGSEMIDLVLEFESLLGDCRQTLNQYLQPSELMFVRFTDVLNQVKDEFEANVRKLPAVMKAAIRTDRYQERKKVTLLVRENREMVAALSMFNVEIQNLDQSKGSNVIEKLQRLQSQVRKYAEA